MDAAKNGGKSIFQDLLSSRAECEFHWLRFDPRNGIDFDLDTAPQNRLHRRSCRSNTRKELGVDGVEPIEETNVLQVASTLDDIVQVSAGGSKYFHDVVQ